MKSLKLLIQIQYYELKRCFRDVKNLETIKTLYKGEYDDF